VDQTGQPYAYTADDPLNGIDPSGQNLCNPLWGDRSCHLGLPSASDTADIACSVNPLCAIAGQLAPHNALARGAYEFQHGAFEGEASVAGSTPAGLYNASVEGLKLNPLTGPALLGGERPYLLHASGDLAAAAYPVDHPDVVARRIAQRVQQFVQCPNAHDAGYAAGVAGATIASFFIPGAGEASAAVDVGDTAAVAGELGNAQGDSEIFYRAMSNRESANLPQQGGLAPRGESFVTQSRDYVQQLAARHPSKYETIVQFNMQQGTRQALIDAGARNAGQDLSAQGLDHLLILYKGMRNVVNIKLELGAINYGLRSDTAHIFNRNIIDFRALEEK